MPLYIAKRLLECASNMQVVCTGFAVNNSAFEVRCDAAKRAHRQASNLNVDGTVMQCRATGCWCNAYYVLVDLLYQNPFVIPDVIA